MSFLSPFSTAPADAAAAAQVSGINAGYGQLAGLYGQGAQNLTQNYRAGLQPFQQANRGANAGAQAYANLLGINGPSGSASAQTALNNMPGYQFALQQGDASVNAAAAANGTLNSGNQLLALQKMNQGLASQNYNNYAQQLQPYLGQQTATAGGIGNLYSGLGNQQANLNVGQGNAAYGAQTSIGNANANAQLAQYGAGANQLNFGMNLGAGLLGLAGKFPTPTQTV